jgi:hypothetical protein
VESAAQHASRLWDVLLGGGRNVIRLKLADVGALIMPPASTVCPTIAATGVERNLAVTSLGPHGSADCNAHRVSATQAGGEAIES